MTDRDATQDGVDATPPSRREFLRRAGSAGVALGVFGPALPMEFAKRQSPLGEAATAANGVLAAGNRSVVTAAAAEDFSSLYSGLKWRLLGPFRGGRVASATGVPGRPNEFYFGSVNGGVWKSIDAGRVWEPIFDSQPVASIGAIAVAPSAPDVIYVGSGESSLRDSNGYGNGMYKSTDAGKTWKHIGLENTQHIGKIAVDPHNPNVLFVAAIGHLYAANPDRGVFRSRDGGATWQKVLYKDENVGAIEVIIDPSNSSVVYAGLWNARRPPWYTYAPTNGPGGGMFKSTDGGNTWKQLTQGLPAQGIGRTGIAVAPNNPRRVYAVVDCLPDAGGFFRSDDAGASWTKLSSDTALWGRGWYFEKVVVDPTNADIVYVPNVSVSRSMDGGKTWVALRGSPGGDDYHQMWISPDDPNTAIVASDQGAVITRNARAEDPRSVTWSSWLNQPTAQIYHLSVDYRFPYWVTGAQQDSGAVAVRSRGKFAVVTTRDWEPIGAGGESGMTAGDPLHTGIIYGGNGQRFDLEANAPVPGTTAPRSPETARSDWTQPLVLSKADPRALYYANQFLFKSTDTAATWTQISPDLTRADPGIPPNLDKAAAEQVDRNGKRGVIYAVAPSPIFVPMVWVGTDDGLIHVTTNNGTSWQNVTPSAITAWSRITTMEASHFDFNAAYASVDRHQLQDFDPYIYRTRDMGKSWQLITNGLPRGVYVHVVKEDPMRQGLLFAGTERGAFVSFNDGDNWQPLQQNLPVTSVRDFEIYQNDLIVATHGRGFWVIDDISALRQANNALLSSDAFLFKPADTTLYQQGGDNGTPTQKDEPQTPNLASGVPIDYFIRSGASGTVSLSIADESGTVLRTFTNAPADVANAPAGGGRGAGGAAAGGAGAGGGRAGAGANGIPNTSALWRTAPEPFATSAGMHRVFWNPAGGGGRGGGGGGRGGAATPPVNLPGTFTAKLTVNGKTYTQSFTVRPDPRLGR